MRRHETSRRALLRGGTALVVAGPALAPAQAQAALGGLMVAGASVLAGALTGLLRARRVRKRLRAGYNSFAAFDTGRDGTLAMSRGVLAHRHPFASAAIALASEAAAIAAQLGRNGAALAPNGRWRTDTSRALVERSSEALDVCPSDFVAFRQYRCANGRRFVGLRYRRSERNDDAYDRQLDRLWDNDDIATRDVDDLMSADEIVELLPLSKRA